MTAAGDVYLEMALRVTVRGTVRDLAALMEMLNASSVVADIASEVRPDGDKCEEAYELCERFGVRGEALLARLPRRTRQLGKGWVEGVIVQMLLNDGNRNGKEHSAR